MWTFGTSIKLNLSFSTLFDFLLYFFSSSSSSQLITFNVQLIWYEQTSNTFFFLFNCDCRCRSKYCCLFVEQNTKKKKIRFERALNCLLDMAIQVYHSVSQSNVTSFDAFDYRLEMINRPGSGVAFIDFDFFFYYYYCCCFVILLWTKTQQAF